MINLHELHTYVISDIVVVNVFSKNELTAGFYHKLLYTESLFCLRSVLHIR